MMASHDSIGRIYRIYISCYNHFHYFRGVCHCHITSLFRITRTQAYQSGMVQRCNFLPFLNLLLLLPSIVASLEDSLDFQICLSHCASCKFVRRQSIATISSTIFRKSKSRTLQGLLFLSLSLKARFISGETSISNSWDRPVLRAQCVPREP